MDDLRLLVDRQLLTDLTTRLALYLDTKQLEEAAALLTDECSLHVGGREFRGRVAVQDFLSSALAGYAVTAHSLTNQQFLIDPADDDRATGHTQVYAWHRPPTATPPDGDLHAWARYHDDFVRTPMGWRISKREIEVLGSTRAPSP